MHSQYFLFALITACVAVPLNINLGAYSPALVVGDGEISLGSTESASELMATLASGAAANGNAAGGEQQQAAAKRAPNLVRTLESLHKRSQAEAAEAQIAAIESAFDWIKRDLPGFNAALTYAREAMQNTPKIELGTPKSGVGIVQNAGLNVPANSAANGAAAKAKRSEAAEEEVGEAPKMTLVAITEV
ncbi:uncharacterized protein EI97DRAFT_492500 [Westerdykella ornata]|uniref:Uncharacterized protein n=1 Tax=Westerdykella ornata TaxID=318751 RepID=A0A6A6JQD0_WESOR|nr:uncharacterized protein EI97DRAFT_492500 [Westerdykella ornata]KAF2278850.1 hypothetical protein EI97DRAFT_492500 [Westerdykella ornata]